MADTDYAAALQRERDHYLASGRKDRAAQVDAELARLGVVPVEVAADSGAPETAVARPKRARKAKVDED